MCNCFAFTAAEIDADASRRNAAAGGELLARSKSPEAHCLTASPDGRCCMSEVQRYYMRRGDWQDSAVCGAGRAVLEEPAALLDALLLHAGVHHLPAQIELAALLGRVAGDHPLDHLRALLVVAAARSLSIIICAV